jgi:hypothetical protein
VHLDQQVGVSGPQLERAGKREFHREQRNLQPLAK